MKLDKYKILFNRQDSTASGKYFSTDNVMNWNRKNIYEYDDVNTYNDIATFSWASTIIGKIFVVKP